MLSREVGDTYAKRHDTGAQDVDHTEATESYWELHLLQGASKSSRSNIGQILTEIKSI